MLPELAGLAVFLPQIEQILAATNTLALAVEAIQATTPAGKKALSDIDTTLARIHAYAGDLHIQITGKQPEKVTTTTTTTTTITESPS
jgi:hypothetical protein